MRCTRCGKENPQSTAVCGACGEALPGPDKEDDSLSHDQPQSTDHEQTPSRQRKALGRRTDLAVGTLALFVTFIAVIVAYIGERDAAIALTAVSLVAAVLYCFALRRSASIGAMSIVAMLAMAMAVSLLIPWDDLADERYQDSLEPTFEAWLHYTVDADLKVTVYGEVVNVGTAPGAAKVEITASGGFPQDDDPLLGGFVRGYVTTPVIEPNGGTAPIRWECTLSYWNGDGGVYWFVEPL